MSSIAEILGSKTLKPKQKTEELSQLALDGKITCDELIAMAEGSKDPEKATCIEALEFATRKDSTVLSANAFKFVVKCLAEKAPRVKWEAAKVVGNTAGNFKSDLEQAITNLLGNTEHSGTVVRWSAAFALGEILKLKTAKNKGLIPALEAIVKREEKNSIQKIYLEAIKAARS